MPNQLNIAKWYLALLSEDYEQGKGALQKDGKYCCLGVACEVAIANGVPVERGVASDFIGAMSYDGTWGTLPESVMEWLGIDNCNPDLSGAPAAEWNDALNVGFEGIAQLIHHEYGLTWEDISAAHRARQEVSA